MNWWVVKTKPQGKALAIEHFHEQKLTNYCALQQQVVKIKQLAQEFEEGLNNTQTIVNNANGLQFNNQDLAKLNSDKVLSSFNLSFGSPKTLYPKPLKHGVIGIFIGLVLAFLWMMADILMRQLKKK